MVIGFYCKGKNTWKPQYQALESGWWQPDSCWLAVPLVHCSTLLSFSSLGPRVLATTPGKSPTATSNWGWVGGYKSPTTSSLEHSCSVLPSDSGVSCAPDEVSSGGPSCSASMASLSSEPGSL